MKTTVLMGVATLLSANLALAQSVDECIGAHEAGQRLEKENHLLGAAKEFAVCQSTSCPRLVRDDCKSRAAGVQKNLPSVVLSVRGGQDVEVQIDDRDAVPVSGGAIELDPGRHELVFFSAGERVESRTITLARGQKEVAVAVELPEPSLPEEPVPVQESAPVPVATWVLGGVAVVGLAGFVGFGLAGRDKQSQLDECKPSCRDQGLYDDMKGDYLRADIALGVTVVAAGAAAFFYVNRDSDSRVGVRALPRAASLTYERSF